VKLPVVFKSKTVNNKFDKQPDAQGGEGNLNSIGVWIVGNKAWKLFPKITDLEEISKDYQKAGATGVPMGDPTFREGTIQQGTDRPTNGFALIIGGNGI
jgi:hypothetical protein